MDFHLTLFLAAFFASLHVMFFLASVSYTVSPGLLWAASSSKPFRIPLKGGTGDIIGHL